MPSSREPILTLEPLVDAVLAGVEGTEWSLSGLQKTTSHEFEGRWEGESTRSAYLFLHRDDREEPVSLDIYLDETSQGLAGNVALVVDLRSLGDVGDVDALLARLATVARRHLPSGVRAPLVLRFRMEDASDEVARSGSEVRFKVHLPRATIAAGAGPVGAFLRASVRAFEEILAEPSILAEMTDA